MLFVIVISSVLDSHFSTFLFSLSYIRMYIGYQNNCYYHYYYYYHYNNSNNNNNTGLEIATDTVAFATEFFLFATRKTRVVANLRPGFSLTDTK